MRRYLCDQSKGKFDTVHNRRHKGKAVPLQAWSGPEGSTKLRFPDFMTTAQDNNNNNIYLLQLGCHPVAVVILHVYKT